MKALNLQLDQAQILQINLFKKILIHSKLISLNSKITKFSKIKQIGFPV